MPNQNVRQNRAVPIGTVTQLRDRIDSVNEKAKAQKNAEKTSAAANILNGLHDWKKQNGKA